MTRTVTRNAFAKINLGLDVVGVRGDGYHLLRMIMQQIDLCDILTLTVREPRPEEPDRQAPGARGSAEESAASGTGADSAAQKADRACAENCADGGERRGRIRLFDSSGLSPAGEDNLICRAIRLMMETYDLRENIDVHLTKRIPVAAGLAGGSADAAAAFCAMRDLFVPEVPDEELMELAVRLGADIPYCIAGGTKLAEGIGERLTALPPMPDCFIVLIKPEAGASTAQVYRALDALKGYRHPDIDGQIRALQEGDLKGLCSRCLNVLELVTGKDLPLIGQVEDFFLQQGALAARMSGSGPGIYAIFAGREDAEKAQEAFLRTELAAGCRTILCRPCGG